MAKAQVVIAQGFSDRLLHRFVLGTSVMRRLMFRLECARNNERFDPARRNVFIAGMARSGSTTLLNIIHRSDCFAATTYADMPLVLSPSAVRWLKLVPRQAAAPGERRHGDGVLLGQDSPEALDGVFWTTFDASPESVIQPHDVNDDLLRDYARFIENLLHQREQARYLGKMNHGIARLAALAGYFHRSLFLVPFRDPLQQALSLCRQHENFTRVDAYEARYLAWLEHYEFGRVHRSFVDTPGTGRNPYSPTSVNYWLQEWRNGYRYLAAVAPDHARLIPLCYESLGRSPAQWHSLAELLDVELDGRSFVSHEARPIEDAAFEPSLLEECQTLYEQLQTLGEARL